VCTVLETNTSGGFSADQKYYAYGRQRDTGPVVTDHKFTGQKLDGTGLEYYNARYYDRSAELTPKPVDWGVYLAGCWIADRLQSIRLFAGEFAQI